MDRILIFSVDSRLFQNSAYQPLSDSDFFQLRQAGYVIGLYGQTGQIESKAHKLRLNLNLFFWLKEKKEASEALGEFATHLQKIALIDQQAYFPGKVVLLSSNLADYQAAKELGFNFIAVCLTLTEAKAFQEAGLSPDFIIIKTKESRIGPDIMPRLL
ncbi:MAG: hypothetical protein WC441_01690 [Patescibacteria group bacterium]